MSQQRTPYDYSQTIKELETSPERNWGAFKILPADTSSSVLLDEERIILLLRQHWVTLLPKIIIALILVIMVPVVANIPMIADLTDSLPMHLVWIFAVVAILGFLLQSIIVWFFNVYIITDERIIDVNFSSILSSDISTTKIDNIQDHSLKVDGFWAAALNYGNVEIQTAAEKAEFKFKKIPQPAKINKLIGELILEEQRELMEGRVK